ncbi:MAG: DUF447 family protein [Gemmataceae bacterium]|nr:DUF447 family protein [Gemmataceae bacterium]
MILEGIVTTLGEGEAPNIAPMGPRLFPPYGLEAGTRFELKPFATSRTAANLRLVPEGVLHVADDVLLLAQAAIGDVPIPEHFPAHRVRGVVLAGACRAHEFRIVAVDDSQPRWVLSAEVVATHRLRDFFGLNRAMHAVVEAAILATRTALLPRERILEEYGRLEVLVEKTGGEREREAFALLRRHVEG